MKHHNDCLSRLFRAARHASARSTEPPFGFEASVLARWRNGVPEDDSLWVLMLLKRAFVAACVVALVSVAVSYGSLREPSQNELTLADSVIKMTLLP
jgi:hypothetical protein